MRPFLLFPLPGPAALGGRSPSPAGRGPDLTGRPERSVRRRGPTDGLSPGTQTAPGRPPATPAEGPGTADDPLLTINMPAGEAGHARQVEVTFSPAEPELTPGAAQAVLAMLLRARETADRTE